MCEESGCPRRCGGQGDLLSGTIGLFSHWAKQSIKRWAVLVMEITILCVKGNLASDKFRKVTKIRNLTRDHDVGM